jgi:hypothetical protein
MSLAYEYKNFEVEVYPFCSVDKLWEVVIRNATGDEVASSSGFKFIPECHTYAKDTIDEFYEADLRDMKVCHRQISSLQRDELPEAEFTKYNGFDKMYYVPRENKENEPEWFTKLCSTADKLGYNYICFWV